VSAKVRKRVVEPDLLLEVRRQDGPRALGHWEPYTVKLAPRMTIAEALDGLATQATRRGEIVAPVVYTWGCVGPGCGSCTMLANGRPVAACNTLVGEVRPRRGALRLEPLDKFEIVRDLLVDLGRMREATTRLRAWTVPAEGEATVADLALARALSRCTRCGACVQACPETRAHGGFVGAAAVAASRLVDLHSGGAPTRRDRHQALTEPGGIHECGRAQNCLEVCPEGLPLDDVLDRAAANASKSFWASLLRKS
jgi:succinate dehydrogenase / fumarate reductase iron-sulfur subunit